MSFDQKIEELGLQLPPAPTLPPGIQLPFVQVKVVDGLATISGHVPQNPDGSFIENVGRVGAEVSAEEAAAAARLTGLGMLGSIQRELGSLDVIETWVKVFGMVNTSPDFNRFPVVINGFSDLILEIFGSDVGSHTRSAIGVAGLPFNMPVEIEAVIKVKE